ncbi:MAG: hypothetical protein WCX12_01660 [Candidatus Paceibacterota bacterium]
MKKYSSLIAIAALFLGFALITPAFAETNQNQTPKPGFEMGMGRKNGQMPKVPGISGTVTAINGSTLTITGKARSNKDGSAGTATTYTVDASNAKVTKGNTTSTVSSIAVGDNIMAQGTITGTNIIATIIRDGSGKPENDKSPKMPKTPLIQGNGQPVIGGSVSAISGTTLTVTNKSNIVYTVNAVNATIVKKNATTTISSVVVGDNLVVQGTINGTSITASSIIDSGIPPAVSSEKSDTPKSHSGFFGSIGNFFSRLFGF